MAEPDDRKTAPSLPIGRAERRLRVAIACPGIGLVQRGFERFFLEIFHRVRGDVDATLFKGGGPSGDGERALTFIPRGGQLVKLLPLHRLAGRTPIHTECLTFALALLPHLRGGAFDIVHTIDPPLTRVLFHLRRVLKMKFRLLYTEGCAMPPGDYPPYDFCQQVARVTYDEAAAFGHRTDEMLLLPCGYDAGRLAVAADRETLRRSHGIAGGTRVILSVAALNRGHKRIDHLVDEVAKLDGDLLLWLDGSMDQGDADLVDYARARLGPRLRVTHVASDKVGELYRLADILVHAATHESFGLALVEAASTGLPVLAHDSPHFAWLLDNAASLVDMRAPDLLANRLHQVLADPACLNALVCAEHVRREFSWDALRPRYLDLYRHMASAEAA